MYVNGTSYTSIITASRYYVIMICVRCENVRALISGSYTRTQRYLVVYEKNNDNDNGKHAQRDE